MPMRPRRVPPDLAPIALFSDVDGTLLDDRGRLALRREQVARLRGRADIILVSSRTLVELAAIHRALGLTGPLLAENGAVLRIPARWRTARPLAPRTLAIGAPVARIRPLVRRAAGAAGVEIVDQRDLLPDRGRSLRRTHSVCLRNWAGADAERFLRALRREGLVASRSGTWITVTRGPNKGTGVRALLALARRRGAAYDVTVAIGNEANDAPLLAAADRRFAIRNPGRGHHPDLLALANVTPLPASGTRAWRTTLSMILPNRRG